MRTNSKWLRAGLAIVIASWCSAVLQAGDIKDYGSINASSGGTQRPGQVVWMDLLTSDVQAAARFYSKVFGWSFDFSPDGAYAYGRLDGRPLASIVAYDEGLGDSEGLWLASISVPDVDAAVSAVKANGGTIIEPPEELRGRHGHGFWWF